MDAKFNVKTIILIVPLFFHLLASNHFQGDFLNKLYIQSTFGNITYRTYHYLLMKSIWYKVSHEQLFHVNKKLTAKALKNTFSLSSVFFLSIHQRTKEFLAFIKATIHAFVISVTCTFSVD